MDSNSLYSNSKSFKAGMNFVAGNYQSAIEGYTELIKESPSLPNNYLYRAISYIKLKEYQKALEDVKEEEKLSKESFALSLNKGISLFNLGNLLEAKGAFNSSLKFAIEKEQKDRITVWINKVNIEMKEKGIIESTNTGELKVIYNWIQTPTTVTVEMKSNHDFNDYEVQIQPKSLVLIDKKDGSIKYDIKLTNGIKPSSSQYKLNGKKIDFILEKEVFDFNWVNLEIAQSVKSQSVAGAYPTSAKAKKDWDKIDLEIGQEIKKDVTADSNEGMWKLFKDIYERSDEKTRRAMMKSFQTSGGTVLSTNWDEVKDKDYEGKDRPEAPKGQEWAKNDS